MAISTCTKALSTGDLQHEEVLEYPHLVKAAVYEGFLECGINALYTLLSTTLQDLLSKVLSCVSACPCLVVRQQL